MTWMRATGRPASIVAALHGRVRGRDPERVLDRIATYEGASTGAADQSRALELGIPLDQHVRVLPPRGPRSPVLAPS